MKKPTLSIAMIDDHILVRKGLVSLINSFEGFTVSFEANHGKHFIELLQQFPNPDIVLLDINMPVMNGYDTAAWIQQHLPNTKVLVLTMLDSSPALTRMFQLGAKGFIIKDCHPDLLMKALVQLRDQGYYLHEIQSSGSNKRSQQTISDDPGTAAKQRPLLTEKEIHFLRLCCSQLTYREIADQMGVAYRTVDSYREGLFTKLNVSTRIGLVLYAIKNGFVRV